MVWERPIGGTSPLRGAARSISEIANDVVQLANRLGLAVAWEFLQPDEFSAADPQFKEADMHVVDPVGVVILIAGVIALVLSTTVIFGRVPERVRAKGLVPGASGELDHIGPSVHLHRVDARATALFARQMVLRPAGAGGLRDLPVWAKGPE